MPKVKPTNSKATGHVRNTNPNHHAKVPAALKHIPAHFIQSWGDRSYKYKQEVVVSEDPPPSSPSPPPPPPQLRPLAIAPPQGWRARKALHPTSQVDVDTPPPPSPLVVVKEEDIDYGVAGLEGRLSDYRTAKSELRDDFPEYMYPSSRSTSPDILPLPDIVVTRSDSMSPSPPSSPLTPPRSPPPRVQSSPAHITSFTALEQYPADSRTHRRSRSHPYSVPPPSNCGVRRRSLYDAISRRQLPRPVRDPRRVVKFEIDDRDSAYGSRYDWRDLRAPRDSISVAAMERRRSPSPIIPDIVLPRFVERNEHNKPVRLPSFCRLRASEEPPSPSHRQTSHLAYFSDY
ncbi:hypothetical protein L226DRAFT_524178 [Lentinus tigrinus ALCF2SS1-7]|uniref:Uncharacterized protein n=1 Tax=Lentinus tigrinus ALCF2SS1-6 TaxID=1328759 RepID=A0A5C2S780_9APHY|nr:hypothetical protein L227DRAFT_601623 [Lentinus tigrinus ALCF2SS1-6]RPD73394.1 hypothetical protein L226DRAFT_524178 [Lentinus tigrinus ALCF2SS1-7]